MPYWMFSVEAPKDKPKVADPTSYLNHLLYEVMKAGNAHQYVDPKIIYGFSNSGRGFYSTFLYALNKQKLLTGNFTYPSPMIVEGANGLYCARQPDSPKEQLYHFLFHLHATVAHLAANPIGRKSSVSATDVARMLTSLPKRAAFVRSGEDVGVMYTTDTSPWMSGVYLEEVIGFIREQTRRAYCTPKEQFATDPSVGNKPGEEPPVSRWEEVE